MAVSPEHDRNAPVNVFQELLSSRKWYNLVPDQSHTLLTAGYGTYNPARYVRNNDYATAAKTPDNTLAVVYSSVSHTLTIVLNNLGSTVTTRWHDPTANTFAVGVKGGVDVSSTTDTSFVLERS